MAFDVQAALTRALEVENQDTEGGDTATMATMATNHEPDPESVTVVAIVATTPSQEINETNAAVGAKADGSDFKHGRSLTGRPRTWTGKIVSIEEWRSLSDWERDGPNGRIWCGQCQDWHIQGECPHG